MCSSAKPRRGLSLSLLFSLRLNKLGSIWTFSYLVPLIFQFQLDLSLLSYYPTHNPRQSIESQSFFWTRHTYCLQRRHRSVLLRSNADELQHIVLRLVCRLTRKKKKLPQFSEVLVWFKGTWLQRSEPSNHSHSLSVYQTTHGWLWLLKKTTSLQNHTSQFRFEFETFQLSGEKSSNSLFFSFCRRLNKNNVNEVSGSFCLTHLCVWLWGGGWSVPDESMNNTQAELADRKMYTLSFIC